MAMFNSYVKLPGGMPNSRINPQMPDVFSDASSAVNHDTREVMLAGFGWDEKSRGAVAKSMILHGIGWIQVDYNNGVMWLKQESTIPQITFLYLL